MDRDYHLINDHYISSVIFVKLSLVKLITISIIAVICYCYYSRRANQNNNNTPTLSNLHHKGSIKLYRSDASRKIEVFSKIEVISNL